MFTINGSRSSSQKDECKQGASNLATSLTIKYSLEQSPPELTPREFCRKMFGISELPEIDILRIEIKRSYQKQCIGLLSKALRVSRQAVLNWGSDELEFPKMPLHHRQTLGLCYCYYKLLSEVNRLRRFIS